MSARYVSPGTYGVSDLDRNGTWRSCPTTAPSGCRPRCRAGWAPYTTGSWTLDPYYGWTWVDTAPWGWAPYHYGRWVSVNGFGAGRRGRWWRRPVYAPALVAFFGGPQRERRRQHRRSRRGLGGTRVGRAVRALVGAARFRPPAVVGRLGRPARREQCGHQPHDRGERAEHQCLSQHQRAERRGGGQRESLRPRSHHVGARHPGGCSPPPDSRPPPGRRDARELRAHGDPRRPASRGESEAAGGRHAPAAHRAGARWNPRAEPRSRPAPRLAPAVA